MNNQLLLKHSIKDKLHTLAVLAILLFLPVFLFAFARYWYSDDISTAYLLAGFGVFVGGGTILIMRKPFIDGLRFSPIYVLDNLGITLVSGKTLRWGNFEKAVVFFVEKEKYIGFKFKDSYRDVDFDNLAPDIASRMISNAAGFPFTFPIDNFTETGDAIVEFVKKRLPVETSAQLVKFDEKSFEDVLKTNIFK